MIPLPKSKKGRRLSAVLAAAGLLAVLGCGDPNGAGKTVPVSGKVLFGGQPLKGGVVTYYPGEGNASKLSPQGAIGGDGTPPPSADQAAGTVGAAPVWMPGHPSPTQTCAPVGTEAPAPPVAIDPTYNDAARTPFTVEVVESPQAGAYDLPLKK